MRFFRELWIRLLRNDCAGMSAEIAYNWMLALIPMLIFLFTLFGIVTSQPDLFTQVVENLRRMVPAEAFVLVERTLADLTRDSNGSLALVSFIGTLWTSSNGAMVIEKALNRAYSRGKRRRNIWRQRLVALLSMLGVGALLILSANLIMFGKTIIDTIEQWLRPAGWILISLKVLRWAMPISGLFAISLFIYTVGPESKEQRAWKTIWPGAVTFVALWILISLLFGIFVATLGNYNKVYGSMAAIIVLLVWLYLTSYAMLIGAEVNALLCRYIYKRQGQKLPRAQYRRIHT